MRIYTRRGLLWLLASVLLSSSFIVYGQSGGGIGISGVTQLQSGTVPFTYISPTPTSAAPGSTVTVTIETTAPRPPETAFFSIYDSDNPNFNNNQALVDAGVQKTVWRNGSTYTTTFTLGSAASYKVIFMAMTGEQQNIKIRTISTSGPASNGGTSYTPVTYSSAFEYVKVDPPNPIPSYKPITVSWKGSNISFCTLDKKGTPIDTQRIACYDSTSCVNTSATVGPLAAGNYTYVLKCSGWQAAPGDVELPIQVYQAEDPNKTSVTLTSSKTTAQQGSSLVLNWSVKNPGSFLGNYCYGSSNPSGYWPSGYKPSSGSYTVTNLPGPNPNIPTNSQITFSLGCYDSQTQGTWAPEQKATVSLIPSEALKPTLDLTLSTLNVTAGTPVTVTWSSKNVDYCFTSGSMGDWSTRSYTNSAGFPIYLDQQKALSGTETVTINKTTRFHIACYDQNSGDASYVEKVITVNVVKPPTTCANSTQTQRIMCGVGQSGYINQSRTGTCSGSQGSLTWGAWSDLVNKCISYAAPTCTPSSETQSLSCPSGQTGIITQSRTSTCPDQYGAPVWGSWVNTSTTCVSPPPVVALVPDQALFATIPKPSINISASSPSITSGDSVAVSWAAKNATSCSASWSKTTLPNGKETLTPTKTTVYSVTCTGQGGSASQDVSVTVEQPLPATVTFTSSGTNIPYNTTAKLSWSSVNAKTCVAGGDWSGNKALSGEEQLPTLVLDKTFTLTCTNVSGQETVKTVTINVAPPPVEPKVTLTAKSNNLNYNSTTVLSWSSSGASSCSSSWQVGPVATQSSFTTPLLTESTSFSVTCTGAGGTARDSINIAVGPAPEIKVTPPPQVTLDAAKTTLIKGQSTTLSWSAINATSCTTPWPTTSIQGGETITPTETHTYTVTCSGDGGTGTQTVTVTVTDPPVEQAPPAPAISLDASKTTITSGESTSLSWSSTNATLCTASWTNKTTVNGTETVTPTSNTTYSVECSGAGGKGTQSVVVTVATPPPQPEKPVEIIKKIPPTLDLTASENAVAYKGSATLTWKAKDATSCTSSGDWVAMNRGISGTFAVVELTSDKNYLMTCVGDGGEITQSVGISVASPIVTAQTFSADTVTTQATQNIVTTPNTVTEQVTEQPVTPAKTVEVLRQTVTQANVLPERDPSIPLPIIINAEPPTVTIQTIRSPIKEVFVTVPPPQPKLRFYMEDKKVTPNKPVTLVWKAENVTSCNATGDWDGEKNVAGTYTTEPITKSKNYNIVCTGEGGSISSFVEINMTSSPPPTLSFVATPQIIQYGKPVSLIWESINALWCKAFGSWSGAQDTSGSYAVDKVGGLQGFKLTCGGPGGEISKEIRFDTKNYGPRAAAALKTKALDALSSPIKSISSAVENVITKETPKDPTIRITSVTKMVDGKRKVFLEWGGDNLKSCLASGAWNGGKDPHGGSEDVGSYTSVVGKTYILTCRGTFVVRETVTVK
jgi:hypothetical protein